ncbi:MAG: nucleotide sugar dehydrogenase [Anaerovoracaceae bacterium]|jgi:UDP-N-acetyl-D-mannosaminuronic acid dehydrogenase
MNICVIGLGYIGLPTAAMFASTGHYVTGVDNNPQVVDSLNKGEIIIEEQGLGQLVSKAVKEGNLKGSLKPVESHVFILAVPTPITSDKKACMSHVISAAESIVPYLKIGDTVILESTSPVGTVDEVLAPILAKSGLKPGTDFYLGHSPERVIPGQILNELVNNSRIAGGINSQSALKISHIYKSSFVKGEIYITDSRTAELCKLAENTFRDVNIAFANELAKICESLGINAWEAIELCNKHPRVNIHQPGPGVGGHCIAVDPWFIVEKEPDLSNIIQQSRITNDSMPYHVMSKIDSILTGIKNPKVTLLGITYKGDVDDVRESPILALSKLLREGGYEVTHFDPFVKNPELASDDLIDSCRDSDLLVLGAPHSQFKSLPFEDLSRIMRNKNLLDTRNLADSAAAESYGFSYHLLGRR